MFEILFLLAGLAIGAAGYRYFLKRDPDALEAWAKKIKGQADTLMDD